MSYSLIVSIVPHNSGEFITDTARNAGASGASILMGRGTAANNILQLLGLGDTSKDIAYIIIENSKRTEIIEAIVKASEEKKAHFGVLFTLNLGNFVKAGPDISSQLQGELSTKEDNDKGDDSMNTYQMINVIVNKGYAEDAMAAARKAGAGGGTIIGARGTAREDDAAFFGMKIVPEKEMLMILVPTDKKNDILQAITSLPCFSEAGSGIVFCNEAKNFTLLGKK